ncbi:MAG: helix-turn-helix domain-containing protein [Herbaspirillum sp.]
MTLPTSVPRPTKPERDEQRRDQILAAAKACVLRHGFHAASMAQIATEAAMSVGQIYRYFDNKEAIVHALVARIVARHVDWIAGTAHHADLATLLTTRMLAPAPEDLDDHVLHVEITAEASRNPTVAAILRDADDQLRAQALAVVQEDHPHLSRSEAEARVAFMAALSEGTLARRVSGLQTPSPAQHQVYRELIARLLPGQSAHT